MLGLLSSCTLSNRPKLTDSSYQATVVQDKLRGIEYLEGHLIVGYAKGASAETIAQKIGASVLANWQQIDIALLQLPQGMTPFKAAASLKRAEGVRYAEPDLAFTPDFSIEQEFSRQALASVASSGLGTSAINVTLNDPEIASQWQHRQMHSQEAWDLGITGKGIRIGIQDDFLDHTHPDLNANVLYPGFDGHLNELILPDTPHDGAGSHASSVAGSAAAVGNNGLGGLGIAYEAQLVPLTIFRPNFSTSAYILTSLFAANGPDGISPIFGGLNGEAPEEDTDSAPGINGYVHVTNNSWGSSYGAGYNAYSQSATDSVNYMMRHGIVVVTSAGNSPNGGVGGFGTAPGVINVGATTGANERVNFSNRGEQIDVAAPGNFVWVTTTRDCIWEDATGAACDPNNPESAYNFISGTSFSSPFTAGAVALILDAAAERDAEGNITNISLDPYQVRKILTETAYQPNGTSGFTDDLGYGIVNVGEAVKMAMDSTQWPSKGATIFYRAVLAADRNVRLPGATFSMIPTDRIAPPEYATASDGASLVSEGTTYFQYLEPGSYDLAASVYGSTFRAHLDLEPGFFGGFLIPFDVDPYPDAQEPNNDIDTLSDAFPVHVGRTYTAGLWALGEPDNDVYVIKAKAGSTYRFNIETLAGNLDTGIAIADGLNEDGSLNVVAFNDDNQDNILDAGLDFTATQDGPLYIIILEVNDKVNPTYQYALDIAEVIGSENEPNGSATAGDGISSVDFSVTEQILLGTALNASLGSNTDTDIFAIALEAGTTVVIDLETATNGEPDTMLGLYDEQGNQISFSDDYDAGADESRITADIDTTGMYYAVVVSWRASNSGDYGISFTCSTCVEHITTYDIDLSPANEVPAVENAPDAQGTVNVTLNETTMELILEGTYQGLTAPATAAHIHGPASKTANGPVVFPLTVSESDTAGNGSITGYFDISSEQIEDLKAGMYYINVHNATNPSGEIRGQIE
ncbi:MAG: S8 family serine peptidase [Deinococcales bacterium]